MKVRGSVYVFVLGSVSALAAASCTITTDLTGLSGGGSAGDGGTTGSSDSASGGSSSGAEGGTSSGTEGGVGPKPGCIDKTVTKRGASASSIPGTFGNTWMPANGALVADDGAIAQVQVAAFAAAGPLVVKKLGLAIPATAYVRGVKVFVKKRGDAQVRDDGVRLVISGNTPTGDDKKLPGAWHETFEISDYGGAADLWGLTLTPSIVSSDGFGVAFNARYEEAGNGIAEVDEIAMTVTYCE